MMDVDEGWYVEFLLRNRDQIRSNIYSSYTKDSFEPAYTLDLEDDDDNNLLLVEKQIKSLIKDKKVSSRELKILRLVFKGKNIVDMEKEMGLSRLTISKAFSEVCAKIAYVLGGIFTNEGYIEYMVGKYNLDQAQIDKLIQFMQSNVKHTLPTSRRR